MILECKLVQDVTSGPGTIKLSTPSQIQLIKQASTFHYRKQFKTSANVQVCIKQSHCVSHLDVEHVVGRVPEGDADRGTVCGGAAEVQVGWQTEGTFFKIYLREHFSTFSLKELFWMFILKEHFSMFILKVHFSMFILKAYFSLFILRNISQCSIWRNISQCSFWRNFFIWEEIFLLADSSTCDKNK